MHFNIGIQSITAFGILLVGIAIGYWLRSRLR